MNTVVLSSQVASFTTTAMAAEQCLAANLPVATSQGVAERLLQETTEAQQARLVLKGIFDLRGLLEAASRKRVLHPVHLDAIASTLEVLSPLVFFRTVHAPLAHLFGICGLKNLLTVSQQRCLQECASSVIVIMMALHHLGESSPPLSWLIAAAMQMHTIQRNSSMTTLNRQQTTRCL